MSARVRGLHVIRGGVGTPSLRAKAEKADESSQADGRLATLEVNFSIFNRWYEINDFWEGRFLERTVPGSFKRTIERSGSGVKVLFNHGFDFVTGDRALAVPELIEEREDSPYLEGGLFDTSYNRDLLPGLQARAYGSSFMFEVLDDTWTDHPERSEHNPEGLPERTIREVRLYEAGPVTWPANPDATAGVRGLQSGAGWYLEQVAKRDASRHDELVRSFAAFRSMRNLRTTDTAPAPAARPVDGISAATRRRRLALIDLE